MNQHNHKTDREMQSNRHLKEWNDHLEVERQKKYELAYKHKRQRDQFFLEMADSDNGALRKQQVGEVQALSQQNNEIRTALQKRQEQEKAGLTQLSF